jgi:membrane protein
VKRARPKPPPAPRRSRLNYLAAGLIIGLAAVALDRRPHAADPSSGGRVVDRQAAVAPTDIDAHGWLQVLKRTWRSFNRDGIPAAAAGATFFALLALFPALGVMVSLYGLFGDVAKAQQEIAALAGVLPGGALSVLGDQMNRLAAAPQASLSLTFAATFVASVWSANAGTKAVIAGLNTAYEEQEGRKFIGLNLLSLSFTLGGVVLALAGMTAIVAAPATLDLLHLSHLRGISLLRWPVLLAVVILTLSVLYRYGPCRPRARWRWVTPGGVAAAIGWLGMSLAFSLYVENFGHYDRTYGSLGAIVGFMTWIWLSLVVVLFGAELNAELERQTIVDTTAKGARATPRRG